MIGSTATGVVPPAPVAPRGDLERLVRLLVERRSTLVTAESLTGGLAAYLLVDEPDSGDVVLGSVVAYSTEEKRRILGVSCERVISGECAAQMANGARTLFGATCALAFTGVAGPTEQEGQPVGTVFIAVSVADRTRVLDRRFAGSPNDIRVAAIEDAVRALIGMLEDD